MRGPNRPPPSGPSIVGPIIIGIFIVAAGIAFALVQAVLVANEDSGQSSRFGELEEGIAQVERRNADLRREIDALRSRIDVLEAGGGGGGGSSLSSGIDPTTLSQDFSEDETLQGTEAPTQTGSIDRGYFNVGLTQSNSRFMIEMLGHPREQYSQTCQSITNPRLKEMVETREIGPLRVTMLKPALESIERVMEKLRVEEPDLYAKLGTAGALCARFIRGSSTSVSNHSWGTAIDIKIEGTLDAFADGATQFGLLPLALAFNEEGWFWGGSWRREDSMHFEASQELVRRWVEEQAL